MVQKAQNLQVKNRHIWVADIETLKSCFTYTGLNVDTMEVVQYVIHKDRNDIADLMNHLDTVKGMIGYNIINFDYPILHYIMKNADRWISDYFTYSITITGIIDAIYTEAQRIIEVQNRHDFTNNITIKRKDMVFHVLDLFKLWHFDSSARSTSLKALEIAMKLPNVQDMPINHTKADITIEEVSDILAYNKNDVDATYEFYLRSEGKINLRKGLIAKYDLPCINYSDTKIGEELTLKLYCEATNKDIWDVKKLRTERTSLDLKDCIFDYVKFNSNTFTKFLTELKSKTVSKLKGELAFSITYKGFVYDYGLGGIHGCIKPGVYESDDNYIIRDADVGSMYPSIAIVNKLYPEHLGEEFCDVYENGIVKPRLAAKKAGDMIMADGYKLSANSVYGKSNDEYSFLKDIKYTATTTLNGQLMLTMLAEDLVDNIPDLTMLQINTDGLTVKVHKNYINDYNNICKKWEDYTKLNLEYVDYNKMVIRDVNNYIAVTTTGKTKYKGAFEIDKDYHKDHSFKIIPIALSEYFVKGIPIEDTIKNHTDIYDFCGRQKFGRDSHGVILTLSDNKVDSKVTGKNIRYYVSDRGSILVKHYSKGTKEAVHCGYYITDFNTYIKRDTIKDYNIKYEYYIKECYKEIENISSNQLNLNLC